MKGKERLVKNSEFAASSQNSKVGGSSGGQHQMVARVHFGQEDAAILLRTLSGLPCDNPEILEMRCCLRKCLEKN